MEVIVKCYACESTPINSRLILHFDNNNPKECYVMCSDCHDGSERRNQIKKYVKFLKEKIKLDSEELSIVNKYIVNCDLFGDDEKMGLVPEYSDYLEREIELLNIE
jgi:hypothetical protein